MAEMVAAADISGNTAEGTSTMTIVLTGLAISILEGYDIQSMGVAAPRLIPAIGLSQAQAGWVFSASMIGLVIGAMFGGWLADRIGRKPVLIASVIAFGVFSLATSIAGSYETLFLVRIATGLGFGGTVPNLIAVANEAAHKSKRTMTTAMMFAGMPFGGMSASLVAQYAVSAADWRLIFVIGGILPIAVAPIIYFRLPETAIRSDDLPLAERPKILSSLLGRHTAITTLLLWTAFVLTLIVLYILLNWLPLLATAKGVKPADAAMSSILYNFGSLPGAAVLSWSVDRYGVRIPMALSYVGATLVMLALASSSGYWAIVTLSGFAGFFVVASLYVLYSLAPVFYPPTLRGTGSGAAVAVGRLGSIFGPLVAGLLLAAGFSASEVVRLLAPVILVGGAAIVLLDSLRRTSRV